MSSRSCLIAGCDLGKATAKFVVGEVSTDGGFSVRSTESVAHEGHPMAAFRDWYARANIAACAALGATGLHADELIAPIVHGLPEDACIEAALPQLVADSGPLNLVSVGARGYSVLTRGADGRIQSLDNDKCSSGTGETMVKIAGRFGLAIDEADELAQAADKAIPITARCSVFAKSEMTHFGNQGRPANELFRGYFGAVANYVAALLARARVDGPVMVLGGGARIGALVRALGEAADAEIIVPEDAQYFEAIGAAMLAGEQMRAGATAPLPPDPTGLVEPRQRRFRTLAPPSAFAHRVKRMKAPEPTAAAATQPAILGLDLGSTGSKAVLTSIATGEQVLDVYDRTRGNPVGAAQRLLEAVIEHGDTDVRAIGVTGSGREAVATVLRAAYPELDDRIVVINEIVAHATAAIRCDEDDGASLSVVEIGGQDAKFIQIVDGHIVESDMNKACSAGTGSFLEEQAHFYGIDDIEQFTAMAKRATRAPDLGQMCTVFVADAAAEAHNEGFELQDLFGGFQYSVIHNYINRVMGQRTFGQRIFFQGKPATGPALGWTLAAVTDREVVVPPNPGAMGAWGIGLCAIDQLGANALAAASAFDLRAPLAAEVVDRAEFQCRDKECATLCAIEKTTVAVGEARQTVLSGGACPKYEISSAASAKLPKQAPSAFDERDAALARYLVDRPGTHTVGVPVVGACHGYVPWLVTLLSELGLGIKVLRSDSRSLARGEERCYSFDACAPVKIAHGVIDADVETIFFPKLLSLADRDGCDGKTCPMEQALPEMVRESLRARGTRVDIVSPILPLAEGLTSIKVLRELVPAVRRLGGARPDRLWRAMRAAAAAQRAYDEKLAEIGRRTLRYGREHGHATVTLVGALHVVHDRSVNAGIPKLLRENGVLALPMDCYPVPPNIHSMPRIWWADTSRALRTAVATRERGDVYPLMLTSFGCGPASFGEQSFTSLMEGYPHTVLESDGHGGTAGYVTRVQAFLHAVSQHDQRPSPARDDRLALLDPLPNPPITDEIDSLIVPPTVGDRISPILAALYRSFGFDSVAVEPASAEALAIGSRDCSGKECVPYQLLWGTFRKHLEEHPPDKRTVLLQVSGEGMCRNCMFSVKDQMSLERMGLADTVAMRHLNPNGELGPAFLTKQWTSVTVWDMLYQLASYYRPSETRPGEVDEIYNELCDRLEQIVEVPMRSGWIGLSDMRGFNDSIRALVDRASSAFLDIARRHGHAAHPRVLLTGDIYVRIDEFASDSLTRRLNERGVAVIVEPTSAIAEYTAEVRIRELWLLPTKGVTNRVVKLWMRKIRERIYSAVRRDHPWLPMTDPRDVIDAANTVIDRYPRGEAAVTIGNVLHAWREGECDGVVVASPWGCGPALVAESLLRHERDIPMMFVYADGSPMDERKLNAFAFRLQRIMAASQGRTAS